MLIGSIPKPIALVAAFLLCVACSGASEQKMGESWQSLLCREARAALLPAVRERSAVAGRIVSAVYTRTDLPRADGQTATVVVDVFARVALQQDSVDTVRRQVGYFENEECWTGFRWWGSFNCYATRPPETVPGTAIPDEHTRRFLSVLTHFATGGEADQAAVDIAANRAFQVPTPGLNDKTSAPEHIDRWYFCQSCNNERARLGGEVSLAGMRFGRSTGATYFMTRSGWTAKLPDTERRASYALCNSPGE